MFLMRFPSLKNLLQNCDKSLDMLGGNLVLAVKYTHCDSNFKIQNFDWETKESNKLNESICLTQKQPPEMFCKKRHS